MSTSASKPVDNIATTNTKEIAVEAPNIIRIYTDGTVERLLHSPFVPPMLQDPTTGVSCKDVVISHEPQISARIYLPKLIQPLHEEKMKLKDPNNQNHIKVPILVYFRGGGFFHQSVFNEIQHKYMNLFVSETDVLVVSVEYRHAPENPLPAAYEDCWSALKWVATNTDPWLIKYGDFNRVFIGGDSAGGNIAHNIAMRAGAEVLPRGVKLFGAFLSHPFFWGSKPIGSEPVEGHEQSYGFTVWNLVYPSAPGGIDNPLVNPLAHGAPSLSGLGCSRLLVCVAGADGVRDRGLFYCEAVRKSGWQGQLEVFEVEDEDHVFHVNDPETENAKKMFRRFAEFLHQ